MTDSTPKRLKNGAASMIEGIRHVYRDREVKKAYRFVLLALFVLTLLTNIAGGYSVWHYTEASAAASTWVAWGLVFLRVVGLIAVLVLAPLVAITMCNLLFPVFSEIPFLAGLTSLDRARGQRLRERSGLGNAAAISNSLRRFGLFLLITIACLVVGWIPIVGPLIAPPLQFYFAAKTISWEMMDPYFDRLKLGWKDQKKVVKRYAPEFLGMGLVCAPLLALPLVGPLLFGLIQAGAASFVVKVFPASDDASDLILSSSD